MNLGIDLANTLGEASEHVGSISEHDNLETGDDRKRFKH
jgi:hypothetical protein